MGMKENIVVYKVKLKDKWVILFILVIMFYWRYLKVIVVNNDNNDKC